MVSARTRLRGVFDAYPSSYSRACRNRRDRRWSSRYSPALRRAIRASICSSESRGDLDEPCTAAAYNQDERSRIRPGSVWRDSPRSSITPKSRRQLTRRGQSTSRRVWPLRPPRSAYPLLMETASRPSPMTAYVERTFRLWRPSCETAPLHRATSQRISGRMPLPLLAQSGSAKAPTPLQDESTNVSVY